ncbi:hypothetical protein [Streptomyces sp. NPDC059168]|uniref:hypothetical protein n=1 Tax=Streptomyces sp. NPDC059168 TaxID=3346753 RepID=UPI0036AAE0EF
MDDRFHELRQLLRAYEQPGHAFDDTLEAAGTALSAYLRAASYAPERAAEAAREIKDLLARGLFNEEIADDVDPWLTDIQGIITHRLRRDTA